MKRLLLGLLLAAAASLLVPLSATAAEYSTFVGCDDLAKEPVPAHICQIGDFPGAYFESSVDTEYAVCVEFPSEGFLCAEEQFAEAGVLYVNSITTNEDGNHYVSWYVKGVEVGSWSFRMNAPPPPITPPPITPPPITPAPPAVSPAPSAECLKAQQQVHTLKSRLRKASGLKSKARIRAKLKKARAKTRRVC